MALDSHYYGDPADVLDRIRAEQARDEKFAKQKQERHRIKKGRRIRQIMKEKGLK